MLLDAVDDQHLWPPVHMLVLALLQLHQGAQRQAEGDAVHGTSPLFGLNLPVDKQVQTNRNQARCQGPEMVHNEHDGDANDKARAARDQVEHPPAPLMDPRRPPGGGVKPSQGKARAVHEGVGHQKAHGQQRCHQFQLPDEHEHRGAHVGEEQGSRGLTAGGQYLQRPQRRHEPVLGHVLQKPRRHDEALQRLTQRGYNDANEGGVGKRIPHHGLHDVAPSLWRDPAEPPAVFQEVALEVVVRGHTAPKHEKGGIEEEAEHNGSKGTHTNVFRRVLEHISPVRAAQDACEARVEEAQHHTEVDALVVVWPPIGLKGLPTQAGDHFAARAL
mmetsp:Transcript_133835/g.317224  ORF Transcript_133835/g.317224 Transcript_133835/m.317224 type:complete len:330 (-) Transcript_133835:784-1773(-)